MKEFNSQDGGRYTFIDDVVNLQNLALAFAQIFDACDNFVISGCNLSGSTVSAGYVYINGKIREFSGGSVAANSSGNRFLYEVDSNEQVPYASGGTKVGRTNYGVALDNVVPSPFGESQPQYITIASDGSCKRLNDAFFGKFALLLNPTTTPQQVKGNVTFEGLVQAAKGVLSKGSVDIETADGKANICYKDSTFYVKSTINGKICQIAMSASAIHISCGKTIATFTDNNLTVHVPLQASKINVGQIQIKENQIFNASTSPAELNINVLGASDRTTNIGDGKGNTLLSVIGASKEIQVKTRAFILSGTEGGNLVFKSPLNQNDVNNTQRILWKDSADFVMAEHGFGYSSNNILVMRNVIGDITIGGVQAVNLYPAIKENGTLLSEKYVLSTTFQTQMGLKANKSDVYDKTTADTTFAAVSKGFAQFLGHSTAAALRQQISALGTNDLTGYVQKNMFLADMATSESDKQKIRQNIGAAGKDDFQPRINDSGWIKINNSPGFGLYARQIGNIVCIQGEVYSVPALQTVFTIPNGIEPPAKQVSYSWVDSMGRSYSCVILGGRRQCISYYCANSGQAMDFSITYMV